MQRVIAHRSRLLPRRSGPPIRALALGTLALAACGGPGSTRSARVEPRAVDLRVATYNVSLSADFEAGALPVALEAGLPRAHELATVIQRVRPDVLVLNELNWDAEGRALDLLADRYLGVDHGTARALVYPYRLQPTCNTGVDAGLDLDGDGARGLPGDAHGFGRYPGQYCLALLSRHPIDREGVRTFQRLVWSSMPEARLPTEFYAPEAREILRLSSKTHAIVPVDVGPRPLHLLLAHPTPPVFDGPEDRNGLRNFDEIRLWVEILDGGGPWLTDDAGRAGGLEAGASFVVAGDHNADPEGGDSRPRAIGQLLEHPRVRAEPIPVSAGALEASGDADLTSDFGLRVDYVLPSVDLEVLGSGVFWPARAEADAKLVQGSDHRLVWVDLRVWP